MSEDAVEGAAKTRAEAARRGGKLPSPWTPAVLELLKDWRARAATTSSQHYRLASSLARLLASLQTFLRFGERAEKHRASAELWAALRREIDEMLALHPTYLASRGDPKQYLDDLRRRMDEIAQQSPELGEHGVWRARRRYDEPSREAASREHLAPPPEPRGVEEQAQRPQPEG
ncbi:MAG: SLATT domain-containing protein [Actinobacteria bacterium]|nr:MAG: SLATT domain-containing protein [Actinomycetota bacterium]